MSNSTNNNPAPKPAPQLQASRSIPSPAPQMQSQQSPADTSHWDNRIVRSPDGGVNLRTMPDDQSGS